MSSPIVSKIPSGIEEIDRLWSGLYKGGTYLVYGRTADGRSVLPLMFAGEGCRREESCLFIATDRPRSLVIHASLIGFDIKEANKNNLLRLVRFPTLSESRGISDDARAETLQQLIELVRKNTPTRLVINDLTPFVQFESSDRFRREMVNLLDGLDELNVTSLIALPEPANVHSQRVISFLKSQVVGSIHVDRHPDDEEQVYSLSLVPNVGHITREHTIDWDLASLVDASQSFTPLADVEPAEPTSAIDTEVDETRSRDTDTTEPIDHHQIVLQPHAFDADPASPDEPQESNDTDSESEVDYGSEVISELNKELEDLVKPFEVVGPEVAGGPIKPEVHESRDTFEIASDYYFNKLEEDESSFLLVGIRLDKTPNMIPRKFDFEFVSEMAQQLLRSYDLILVDEERQNMVILLASSKEEAANGFFRRLREKLLQEAPNQAANLMQSIAAIVAINGEGFKSTREFLDYIDRSS